MPETPQRSRAVFSTEDFDLMKEAIGEYIKKIADDPRSAKFSNLYHRLGRLG
jgi:predicted Zn-dependent peptidase